MSEARSGVWLRRGRLVKATVLGAPHVGPVDDPPLRGPVAAIFGIGFFSFVM